MRFAVRSLLVVLTVSSAAAVVAQDRPAAPAAGVPAAGQMPSGGTAVPGTARQGVPVPPQAPPPSPASIERANQILAAARTALGGPKLAAIKTLVANGRTKRVRGNNLVPIEFEINIELPDKYLRKDESPAEETDPTSSGFNSTMLIQLPVPPTPQARAGGPPAPTQAQLDAQKSARVTTLKQDFVRFALGMFVDSFETYPLTFAYAAQAEAPQGKADVLDVRGAGNFLLKFYIYQGTHLPIMVSWTLPPTNVIVTVPGQPAPASVAPGAVVVNGPAAPAANAAQADKDAYAKEVLALRQKAQATPVEHRIYYADYRDVDGVQLPFRLRRAIGTDTTEETTFDRFRINTKIDPKKFESAK